MISEERLKEIEERANAATPGPWINNCAGYIVNASVREKGIVIKDYHASINTLEFIAHSRQDIPDLITEIRRLREALEAIAAPAPDNELPDPDATDEENADLYFALNKKRRAMARQALGIEK